MLKSKKNAFTLIELIAVLVIMAIIALIVTPLVMSIIRKARVSADKRSIDAYGRSIELAIAGYLMDNGSFPTSIEQLTIEYSGDEVVCINTQLNSDSSIYLAGCTVGGRSVEGYTYGKEDAITYDYIIGDEVSYNNVDYYVIKDSSSLESSVTLLKAEPLTVSEVNQFGGVGTESNVVNKYVVNDSDSPNTLATAYDKNGYGGMAYYESSTCHYIGRARWVSEGCTNDYEVSNVKFVVDAWKTAKAPAATEARLITYDELIDYLGYDPTISSSGDPERNDNVPTWVYNSSYSYWTSSPSSTSSHYVFQVRSSGDLGGDSSHAYYHVVRPVIVLPKSAL